jgi:hypothetical protein
VIEIVVLPRFADQVRIHLASNYLNLPVRPLILGIFGESGDGKSAQLATALTGHKVNSLRINAADLESGLAGEPGKLVERTYAIASLEIKKGNPAAIVVDDVDTTVGEWEHNTGTVNHQQVLAELMHLADRPVDPARNHPCRVPIFVTGNDLGKLYPPLRRHRRMQHFHWRPTEGEKRHVVGILFHGIAADHELDDLVARFSYETLSFFGAVYQATLELQFKHVLATVDQDMRKVLSGRNAWSPDGARAQLDKGGLIELAAAVQVAHQETLHNFLKT